MKIVKFLGGLGNQMFQYALYKQLQKQHEHVKADVTGYKNYTLHHGLELEKIFPIDLKKATRITVNIFDKSNRKWIYRKLRRLFSLKSAYQEEENEFTFDPTILTDPSPKLLWGYWQHPDYFRDIVPELSSDFTFTTMRNIKNLEISEHVKRLNSVALHVRRGDYVNHPQLGGICDLEYYKTAIEFIGSKINQPAYFIFSDDIPWCRKNLPITDNVQYVTINNGKNSHLDMQLMSECKHNIIANSSFSWWAAWLNENPDKIVIGPNKWTQGQHIPKTPLILPTWTGI